MQSRSGRRAVVLVVDGLGAGFLGPYGNTWIETPGFNQLANDGLLCEQSLVDSVDLPMLYRSLWTGLPGCCQLQMVPHSWLRDLADFGHRSRLVTDEQHVVDLPLAAAFSQADLLLSPPLHILANSPEQTGMAKLLAAGLTALEEASPAELVWIHSRGMFATWDAPWEFRSQFADEEDPEPPQAAEPPDGPVPAEIDPDELQGWLWAYAGQIALLDLCLEPLLTWWREQQSPTLLVVMGARGYPLGEHGHWGTTAVRMHSERVHVPLFVARNDRSLARRRCQSLVQPSDVAATLRDWFQLPAAPDVSSESLLTLAVQESQRHGDQELPLVICRDGEQWGLRTPMWHCCLATDSGRAETGANIGQSVGAPELYLKPDDRWDANNVASRCPPTVERFRELRDVILAEGTRVPSAEWISLPPELLEGLA